MARWSVFPTTTMAIALAVSSSAFADQKKPASKTGDHPTENLNLNYGKIEWSYKKGPGGSSTGPTVPPKPVGSTLAAPKLGGSTGPTVPPKPTQGNTNR